ncbi:MAG: TonB-dependent receptor [Bacteroidetes bacterium]|nr:TonB-dependent receptor [Bacteroidota bacterium]
MQKYLVLFAQLLLLNQLFSQPKFQGKAALSAKVYGKIIDSQTNQPLEFVTVVLKTNKDSLLTGSLSKSNGDFMLDGITYMGPCKLYVSFIGYKTLIKPISINPQLVEQDIGNLKFEPNIELLKETEVVSEKSTVQMNIDRRVYNVDKDLSTKGGNGLDVMKNVPGLAVDADNNVTLRNSNVQIFIDGRPTTLQMNQLAADQIEQVEVISNPSVKFDASSSGGIVNIVMKKNVKPGYNGLVTLGVGTNDRYNANVSLNFKKDKINLSAGYNFNKGSNPTKGYVYRTSYKNETPFSYYDQDADNFNTAQMQNVRLGLDYSMSNRSSISFTGFFMQMIHSSDDVQVFKFSDSDKVVTLYGDRLFKMEGKSNTFSGQIFFKHKFPKPGKELTSDLTYNKTLGVQFNENTTSNYISGNLLLPENPVIDNLTTDDNTNVATYQLDFVNPISDSLKIEMGFRSNYKLSSYVNTAKKYNYTDDAYYVDTFLTNVFDITEIINAGYFNYIRKLKKGFGFQAGLRFEQTYFVGNIPNKEQSFSYSYPSKLENLQNAFFPAIYFSKKMSNNQEFQLNFSRKISRGNFFQMNPNVHFIDKQNIRIGNPNLKPEFINMGEVNYNKIFSTGNVLVSLYSKYVTDPHTLYFYQSPTDSSLFINTFINADNRFVYGIEKTIKWSPSKKMDITFNVNTFNTNLTAGNLTNSGFTFSAKSIIAYRLPFNISAQLNGDYEHPRILPQGKTKYRYGIDFSVNKIISKAWNVSFLVSDIFNSRRFGMDYETPEFTQVTQRRREARFFRISATYNFGKQDLMQNRNTKKREPGMNSGGGDEM